MDLRSPRILSLCSGVGGLDLGLKLAMPSCRTVAYVEIEAYACEILARRCEEKLLDDAPIWSDLRTFDGGPWRGRVDCIAGGYPCQPFSIAGKKLGDKDPRHLWPHIAKLVAEIEPALCFFENVGGHLRLGFEQVHDDLQGMGYRVKAGLFTAEEVGAPHKRERLFVLAYRPDFFNQGGIVGGVGERESELPPACRGCDVADGNRDGRDREIGAASGEDDTQRRAQCPADAVFGGDGSSARRVSVYEAGFEEIYGREALSNQEDTPAVENAERFGRRGRRDGGQGRNFGQAEAPGSFGSCRQIHLWPPRSNELEDWRSVSEDLKPAIYRVADGMADRVDEVRACGNGVVPLVAAYAFRTLAADLWHEWE